MATRNDETTAILILSGIVISGIGLIIAAFMYIGPQYGVWEQSLSGKAELQKAEYTRQVKVLEAKALKDASVLQAEAEVIRAGGVAKANEIIGTSLKGNHDYLSYLWITGLEDGAKNGNKTIYMIPSQGNIPAPVFNVDK